MRGQAKRERRFGVQISRNYKFGNSRHIGANFCVDKWDGEAYIHICLWWVDISVGYMCIPTNIYIV